MALKQIKESALDITTGVVHRKDALLDDADPFVVKHPGLFVDPVAASIGSRIESASVEQATAAPGEKRTAAPKG
jgi:hypothetical protein